jgi:hypothetical protein
MREHKTAEIFEPARHAETPVAEVQQQQRDQSDADTSG